MRKHFETKHEALAWILSEIVMSFGQGDIPDFSKCLKTVIRISHHRYAYRKNKYEVTITTNSERVASRNYLPSE
jgi:hypothetical protein